MSLGDVTQKYILSCSVSQVGFGMYILIGFAALVVVVSGAALRQVTPGHKRLPIYAGYVLLDGLDIVSGDLFLVVTDPRERMEAGHQRGQETKLEDKRLPVT